MDYTGFFRFSCVLRGFSSIDVSLYQTLAFEFCCWDNTSRYAYQNPNPKFQESHIAQESRGKALVFQYI